MVALPKRTLKELEAIQASSASAPAPSTTSKVPEPKPIPDKGDEYLKDTKEVKKKSLADLLKNYSKKDKVSDVKKVRAKSKEGSGLNQKQQALLAGLVKRGNKVQKGEALVGNGSAEVLSAVQAYATRLPGIVKPFWKIPSYLADKGLRARIRVFINSQGRIVRAVIYESSGDDEYDNRALAAVKKASPFPVPEQKISKNILNGDILLGFPL
jgi:TolA protein